MQVILSLIAVPGTLLMVHAVYAVSDWQAFQVSHIFRSRVSLICCRSAYLPRSLTDSKPVETH